MYQLWFLQNMKHMTYSARYFKKISNRVCHGFNFLQFILLALVLRLWRFDSQHTTYNPPPRAGSHRLMFLMISFGWAVGQFVIFVHNPCWPSFLVQVSPVIKWYFFQCSLCLLSQFSLIVPGNKLHLPYFDVIIFNS